MNKVEITDSPKSLENLQKQMTIFMQLFVDEQIPTASYEETCL